MLEFIQAHLFEIIGYVGSACVLISFLMSSVVKLRIINSVGCIVSVIYGFLIGAYPTIVMNGALLIINIVFLIKMSNKKNSYTLLSAEPDSDFVKYFLDSFRADIQKFFPDYKDGAHNFVRIAYCGNTACGILIGDLSEDGTLHAALDYATPQYRDFSVGLYQIEMLREEGVKNVTASTSNEVHAKYLQKLGFKKKEDVYVKNLNA